MNKNKKRIMAIAIAVFALLLLTLGLLNNNSTKSKSPDKKVVEITQEQEKKFTKTAEDEEKERLVIDEKFKDADEFLMEYMIAVSEENNPLIKTFLVEGTKSYDHFMTYTSKLDEHVNKGRFDNVYVYHISRYSSLFEDTGMLYYVYTTQTKDELSRDTFSESIFMSKNEKGEWQIEQRGGIFPQELQESGPTASKRKTVVDESAF